MGILAVLALRDYRLLLTANIAEFCGSTLAELALLIFLYDATGSAIALGGLGGAFVLSIGFVSIALICNGIVKSVTTVFCSGKFLHTDTCDSLRGSSRG